MAQSARKIRKSKAATVPCQQTEGDAIAVETARWYEGKSLTFDWTSYNFPNWVSLLAPYRRRAARVLEIGSWEGRSALFFLNYLPKAELTCIDTFEGGEEHRLDETSDSFMRGVEQRFRANTEAFRSRIEIVKARSGEALARLGVERRRYDIAYIDGSHMAHDVYADAVLTWPMIKSGGIVIFDDYLWGEMPGPLNVPKPGIDAFLKAIAGQHRVVLRGYQVAIVKH